MEMFSVVWSRKHIFLQFSPSHINSFYVWQKRAMAQILHHIIGGVQFLNTFQAECAIKTGQTAPIHPQNFQIYQTTPQIPQRRHITPIER